MNEQLNYPFDGHMLLRKRKALKRELLKEGPFSLKKIAILGGSTTHDVKEMLELFLLNQGIEPVFFESEFGRYWQDSMFDNEELMALQPDIIYVHTSNRNIHSFPQPKDTLEEINSLLDAQIEHFLSMWEHLHMTYHCPIIQNNFELPFYRLMGNQDAFNLHGRVNFITRLNMKFYEYAQSHKDFYINDIHYQSADYGLKAWSDPYFWYMYKLALCMDAIPSLAFQVSNIIKSIFGHNKKAIALDLDNTLWGGIVGDDGVENLILGNETAKGQVYTEFQDYLMSHQKMGILLNVISKNQKENALAGLNHPQMILKRDAFISVKTNWEPKSLNLTQMAEELTLLPETFVFVDDNPAEREIVRQQVHGVGIPRMDRPEHYIYAIDRAGYFETTVISADDLTRNEMYQENAKRTQFQHSFADYAEYLHSLKMRATIAPFAPIYLARIAQLTNKSNQFNLTTRRYTQEELEVISHAPQFITLYGKLEDCFGDNGIVTVVLGEIDGRCLHILLWLMSCRVLKRDMEYAMMDKLVSICREKGVSRIRGDYYPTTKNKIVSDFYKKQGFLLLQEDTQGNTEWELDITHPRENRNQVIEVMGE